MGDFYRRLDKIMSLLPYADPDRVLEIREITESSADRIRHGLEARKKGDYEVRFIFTEENKRDGIAHIRRLT
jgi:hypothetical protein